MKKKQPLTITTVAALAVGFYIFDKFGGVNAIKDIGPPSRQEAGYLSQAEWEAKGYGFGSTDYEDWLRGR
jgi:hypothetical protein